jgi:hypothetical protein
MLENEFEESWMYSLQLGIIRMKSSNVGRDKTCRTCKYWDKDDNEIGEESTDTTDPTNGARHRGICRRYPPNIQTEDGFFFQPITSSTQLCGEHSDA